MYKRSVFLVLSFALVISFSVFSRSISTNEENFLLKKEDFNKKIEGKQVGLYFLKNGKLSAAVTNYGGRLVSLCVPDKNNKIDDVVLGFKSIDDYLKATGVYHGATIGRVAGRIANGSFEIDKTTYSLELNSPPNHLHGGSKGFHNQVWDVVSSNDTSVVMTYRSVDGEMGYPGNLQVELIYTLNRKNELSIEYSASTDKNTFVNLTNHAFFNLTSEGNGSVLNHLLTIPADYFCQLNAESIPTGEISEVKNTPFDFRKQKQIGKDLNLEETNEQLKNAGGYDHSFVLNKKKTNSLSLAAVVVEPLSGRKMEISTTEPCVHFFSANFFKGTDIGKNGKPFNYRESFALETQRYPFSPFQNSFPSILLHTGEKYEAKTIYRFTVVKL